MINKLVHWIGHFSLFISNLRFPLIWLRWCAKVHELWPVLVHNLGGKPGAPGSIKEKLRMGSEGRGVPGALAQLGREFLARHITFSQK